MNNIQELINKNTSTVEASAVKNMDLFTSVATMTVTGNMMGNTEMDVISVPDQQWKAFSVFARDLFKLNNIPAPDKIKKIEGSFCTINDLLLNIIYVESDKLKHHSFVITKCNDSYASYFKQVPEIVSSMVTKILKVDSHKEFSFSMFNDYKELATRSR